MDLKQYEQKKFAIAEIIRSAQAVDVKDGSLLSECRELSKRLAEDRFNLMVVGRFSRGKSTLMNAILGGEHLPTGIVPLTSVITTVRYGSRQQVVLHFNNSGLNTEAPLTQLASYVTQKENPGNIKNVAYAEIQLPIEILRRGFFFVDSPGLGSSIVENTLTTERFLPEADAFILVTSYESPLSEEEDRILHRIRNADKKLFVVINKQDTVNDREREDASNFVAERLKELWYTDASQIFSISARQGLAAKMSRSPKELEGSGIQAFEAELLRFLTEERAQSFLVNMYERTMNFLAERARSQEHPEQEECYQTLMGRLRDLRETILGIPNQPEKVITVEQDEPPSVYKLQVDKKTGCRICGSVLEGVFRFLSKYQYELTINPQVQRDHARRGGFCPLHTWQYEGISSQYGVCTAYPELAHRLAAELKEFSEHVVRKSETAEKIGRLLPTIKTCPVCEARTDTERRAVKDVASIAERVTKSDNEQVPACCLPHLKKVIELLGPGLPAQQLLKSHATFLERTAEDLQRYALKHDALRRYLTSEEERRASQLALLLLAGHRHVSAPWAIEYIL